MFTESVFADLMRPEDVGLTQKMQYFRNIGNPGRPPVTYLHIYESDRFSVNASNTFVAHYSS